MKRDWERERDPNKYDVKHAHKPNQTTFKHSTLKNCNVIVEMYRWT